MIRTLALPKNLRGARWAFVVTICALLIGGYLGVGGAQAGPAPAASYVPCGGSIQAAINAAHSGETILLARCTYVQQLTIDKSVNILGAGAGRTIVQSPVTLNPGDYTIEIGNGATVALSGLTIVVTNVAGVGILVVGSTAAIHDNSIEATSPGALSPTIGIEVTASSTATITSNVIVATAHPTDADEAGIWVLSSVATIAFNSVTGPGGTGIYLSGSTATVAFNSISQFECSYNPTYVAAGFCGPSWESQGQSPGIADESDAGLGTTIEYNLISTTDAGILLFEGCPGCVVKGNIVMNSFDYGLAGFDGTYTFLQNTVIGGAYGVGAAALYAVTTVTLSHVLIVGPSVAPLYTEPDLGPGTATIGGTWTAIG
jgi:Right handed beta helix region